MTSLTIPNIITFFRLALIGPYLYLFLHERYREAIIVFCIAAISDVIDGGIARYFSQRSKLGSILDPAADKLLMLCTYVTLGITGWLPMWVSYLVIGRDVYIVFGIVYLVYYKKRKDEIHPSIISKINTFFQLLCALCYFLKAYQFTYHTDLLIPLESLLANQLQYVLYTMILTTLMSWGFYTQKGIEILVQDGDTGKSEI